MKRFFSSFVAFILCINLVTPAFAQEETANIHTFEKAGITVTTQNIPESNEYMVRINYDDHYEIATRDNTTYTIRTQIYDLNGNLLDAFTTDASVMLNLENIPQMADYYQHTLSNYEYDVDTTGRHEVWTCRRNQDYKTKTNLPGSITEERLIQWKYFVDEINDIEKKLAVEVGISVVKIVAQEIATGGLATALAYLQGSVTVIALCVDLDTAQNNADDVFDRL